MSYFNNAPIKQVLDERADYAHYLGISRDQGTKLVTINSHTSVAEALQTMKLHRLTALVVVDAKEPSRFLGIINVFDLLVALVFQPCFDAHLKEPEAKDPAKLVDTFKATVKTAIFTAPAAALLGIGQESTRVWSFEDDVSFTKLASTLAQGVHRVLVVPSIASLCEEAKLADELDQLGREALEASPSSRSDERAAGKGKQVTRHMDRVVSMHEVLSAVTEVPPAGERVAPASDPLIKVALPTVVTKELGILEPAKSPGHGHILTQTDAAAFAYLHKHHASSLFHATLADLGLAKTAGTDATKEVVSVRASESALLGFRRLLQSSPGLGDLAALPVVGESGVLLGNLSASDLRSITGDNVTLLLLPVLEYLSVANGCVRAVVTCSPQTTLGTTVHKILHSRVHRAYVVDEQMRVLGVVSLSDVLARVASFGLKVD